MKGVGGEMWRRTLFEVAARKQKKRSRWFYRPSGFYIPARWLLPAGGTQTNEDKIRYIWNEEMKKGMRLF